MTKTQGKSGTIDVKALLREDEDFLRALVRTALQEVLEAEMTEALGAEKGERTAERQGYRSGYYGRTLITRIGKLELWVPQTAPAGSRRSCSSAINARSGRWWRRRRRCTVQGVATHADLRESRLIGLIVYDFARIGAAWHTIEDVYKQNRRLWVRLREKDGKRHAMPCHHNFE